MDIQEKVETVEDIHVIFEFKDVFSEKLLGVAPSKRN